jgi:aminoglycoside phosphotransferase (APT) family kinase protein
MVFSMTGIPDAEYDVTVELARLLVAQQCPGYSHLLITPFASGFDNVMFRLGDDLAVRIPRRKVADSLVLHEQQWLPYLAPSLPVAIPAPVYAGKPALGYPWHWSVLPWFTGDCADCSDMNCASVRLFLQFLQQLHQPAPADAPANPVRGVPLSERLDSLVPRMTRLKAETDVITAKVEKIWERGLLAPVATDRHWLHGDLHAQNVLVEEGSLQAVIDWGDITAGDVATDLQCIWGLFADASERRYLLENYAPDQATLERAQAWGVLMAVMLVDTGRLGSPRHEQQGRLQLQRLLADN